MKIRNLSTPRAIEPQLLAMHLDFLDHPVRTVVWSVHESIQISLKRVLRP